MLFCVTAQYTSQALNSMLDDAQTNRVAAVEKLIGAAGGKTISVYSTASDGPGVMVIFDVPEPSAAPAIAGIAVAGGAVQNLKLMRLMTPDDVSKVRTKAREIRASYKAPGK